MGRDRDAYVVAGNSGTKLTRRTLLKQTGWMMVAAMVPPGTLFASDPVSPVMAKLSSYMSEARNRALPDEVLEKTKQHALDTIAAMVSGANLPPGRAALKFAKSYGGEKVATVVGSNILSGAIEAALVNGILAHSDETDDSHASSFTHPGAPTIPATLAVGEQFGIDGMQFLRAVTLGYDVGTRVTITMGGRGFQNTTHESTHSIGGLFSAAAAAGCAASLSAQQMRWLLDYTAQQSAGIGAWQRDTDHIEKAFVFAGGPARSGVTSALVVQSGWTGVDDILSGADNFLQAYAAKANPEGLIDKLGENYEVVQTDIKKWTVGSPIQAPLDALENLLKRRPFQPEQVKEVIVRVANDEAAIVDNRALPDICMQHMVAVMLIDKTASFAAAHDSARMKDPVILRERAKVRLIPSEELQRLLPQRVAIVEVTLTDGAKLTERIDAVRGTAKNPMPRDEIVTKCRDLMGPILGAPTTTTLIERVLSLENTKNIRELRPLLQRT